MVFQLFILDFCHFITHIRPNRSGTSLRAAKGHSNRGNSGWIIFFFPSILHLKKERDEDIFDNGQEFFGRQLFSRVDVIH